MTVVSASTETVKSISFCNRSAVAFNEHDLQLTSSKVSIAMKLDKQSSSGTLYYGKSSVNIIVCKPPSTEINHIGMGTYRIRQGKLYIIE
jgi:hypothetical protein